MTFEYRVIDVYQQDLDAALNEQAAYGWRLVGTHFGEVRVKCILERRVPVTHQAKADYQETVVREFGHLSLDKGNHD